MNEEEMKRHKRIQQALIGGGIFVGILIVIGLFISLQPFLHGSTDSTGAPQATSGQASSPQAVTNHPGCTNCVFQEDNNKALALHVGDSFTIDLPQTSYPKETILLIANPENMLSEVGANMSPQAQGDWVKTYQATQAGVANIIVKSSLPSVSDFHVSIVVQ